MIKNIIIFLSTILLFAAMAWATVAATPTPTMQQVLQTPVDYTLPYPGILPDNFLYPLKAFRDRVVSFFIPDSQKQAQFDLLQADKRLAAGESMLTEENPNTELISQTVSKGENYFGQSIDKISQAQKEGQLVNDFLATLSKAGLKHEQVLYSMSQKTQGQLLESLLSDIARVQVFENQVKKISQQHK